MPAELAAIATIAFLSWIILAQAAFAGAVVIALPRARAGDDADVADLRVPRLVDHRWAVAGVLGGIEGAWRFMVLALGFAQHAFGRYTDLLYWCDERWHCASIAARCIYRLSLGLSSEVLELRQGPPARTRGRLPRVQERSAESASGVGLPDAEPEDTFPPPRADEDSGEAATASDREEPESEPATTSELPEASPEAASAPLQQGAERETAPAPQTTGDAAEAASERQPPEPGPGAAAPRPHAHEASREVASAPRAEETEPAAGAVPQQPTAASAAAPASEQLDLALEAEPSPKADADRTEARHQRPAIPAARRGVSQSPAADEPEADYRALPSVARMRDERLFYVGFLGDFFWDLRGLDGKMPRMPPGARELCALLGVFHVGIISGRPELIEFMNLQQSANPRGTLRQRLRRLRKPVAEAVLQAGIRTHWDDAQAYALELIQNEGDRVRMARNAWLTDYGVLERLNADAHASMTAGDAKRALGWWHEAAALIRGEPLAGCKGAWVPEAREQMRERLVRMLDVAARQARAQGVSDAEFLAARERLGAPVSEEAYPEETY